MRESSFQAHICAVNKRTLFQFIFQALQHFVILNKHFSRIQNAV
jgi:hypothetical protein